MAYPAKRSRAAAVVEAARAVANALGVRPASLYTHVGDLVGLEGLLAETATAAMAGVLDDTDAAVAVWAFLHGYAALGVAGLCGGSGPTPWARPRRRRARAWPRRPYVVRVSSVHVVAPSPARPRDHNRYLPDGDV